MRQKERWLIVGKGSERDCRQRGIISANGRDSWGSCYGRRVVGREDRIEIQRSWAGGVLDGVE